MKKVFGKALCFLLLVMLYMPAVFSQVSENSDLPDLIPYRKGNKWGFCDRNKKIIIPVIFDTVSFFGSSFSSNVGPVPDTLACVKQGGKEYWINKTRKRIDFTPRVHNRAGQILEEASIGGYNNLIFRDAKTGKKGLLGREKKDTILPARYEDVKFEGSLNNYVAVKEKGRWGIMQAKTQKWLLSPEYDAISRHYETVDDKSEVYIIRKGNLNGLFMENKLLLPVQYTNISVVNWYERKVILIKDRKGAGMVDLSGKPLTTVSYEHLEIIPGYFIYAKRNGKFGLLTYKGKEAIACKYEYIDRNDNRNMYLVKYKGRGGWIDKRGTEYFED